MTNERRCPECGSDMAMKRPQAVYCSRRCKTRASDRRRIEDGRSIARDHERYGREGEQRRAASRLYFASHRADYWTRKLRRRALRAGVPVFRFSAADWVRLVARFNGRCAYCGSTGELQPDHVIPIARGGGHGVGNVVPACGSCNSSKGPRFLVEWRRRRRSA